MFRVFTYRTDTIKYYKDFETEAECKQYAKRKGWDIYYIEPAPTKAAACSH